MRDSRRKHKPGYKKHQTKPNFREVYVEEKFTNKEGTEKTRLVKRYEGIMPEGMNRATRRRLLAMNRQGKV